MSQSLNSVKEVVRHEMPELSEGEVAATAAAFLRSIRASGLEVYVVKEGD